jgi:hypothetical protein
MNSGSTSKSFFQGFTSSTVMRVLVWGMAFLMGCGVGQEGSEFQDSTSLDGVTAQGLAVPSNVQAFYAEGQWRTPFGAQGPYYSELGHRGLDIAANGDERRLRNRCRHDPA